MKNRKISIMLVEDEALIALNLQMELELEGFYICACVATGEEAVEKAGTERPALILMDVNLAGEMDGITAAGKILNRYPDCRVIFMTGYSKNDITERLNRLHISSLAFLLKPVEVDAIKPLIDQHFGTME